MKQLFKQHGGLCKQQCKGRLVCHALLVVENKVQCCEAVVALASVDAKTDMCAVLRCAALCCSDANVPDLLLCDDEQKSLG